MSNKPPKLTVAELFIDYQYVVPIYQRNYAWDEKQIVQLLEDIDDCSLHGDDTYFLGNVVVNQTDLNAIEVIDGQQRLTTLFLIKNYLKLPTPTNALRFEARNKSNRTLSLIENSDFETSDLDTYSQEILNGYQVIKDYFESSSNPDQKKERFKKKLQRVSLIQVPVPKNIDLNHYFEIMNTRGEQLELHEIVKAKILNALETNEERNLAGLIWDKCSDMDSYVQMNFNPNYRSVIFDKEWSDLSSDFNGPDKADNFNKILIALQNEDKSKHKTNVIDSSLSNSNDKKNTLISRLVKNQANDISNQTLDEENERFESSISFPNFLLQVNSVIQQIDGQLNEQSGGLNDKGFINKFEYIWMNSASNSDNAKSFIYHVLKCRILFDKFIVKREYAHTYKENGKWALMCLKKDVSSPKGYAKPKYSPTFSDKNDKDGNSKLKTLQSCLRITYTSPKTMYWITIVLVETLKMDITSSSVSDQLIDKLEDYAKRKVLDSGFENKTGFQIDRIVFSYLDYLFYRDGYKYDGTEIIPRLSQEWNFQFRKSIEHFFPQHPSEVEKWPKDNLDDFGNLALITVSGNSKFSNLLPKSKVDTYKGLVDQSHKLKVMANLLKQKGKWTIDEVKEHGEEMRALLIKDVRN